jgi:hypothetical protein
MRASIQRDPLTDAGERRKEDLGYAICCEAARRIARRYASPVSRRGTFADAHPKRSMARRSTSIGEMPSLTARCATTVARAESRRCGADHDTTTRRSPDERGMDARTAIPSNRAARCALPGRMSAARDRTSRVETSARVATRSTLRARETFKGCQSQRGPRGAMLAGVSRAGSRR